MGSGWCTCLWGRWGCCRRENQWFSRRHPGLRRLACGAGPPAGGLRRWGAEGTLGVVSEFPPEERRIVELVRREIPGVRGVVLYGSRVDPANPYLRDDSDWDIAVLPDPTHPVPAGALARAQLTLWEEGDFNIVDPLRTGSDELLYEILRHQRPLWLREDGDWLAFVVRAARRVQERRTGSPSPVVTHAIADG